VATDLHGIEKRGEWKSTARGADYNRSARDASKETQNFCAPTKMLRAWHAFWGIDAKALAVVCASHAARTKTLFPSNVRVVERTALAPFHEINRL
jgi:hypothetical protein